MQGGFQTCVIGPPWITHSIPKLPDQTALLDKLSFTILSSTSQTPLCQQCEVFEGTHVLGRHWMASSTFNSFYKVLFTIRSLYLFTIGHAGIFNLGRDTPPRQSSCHAKKLYSMNAPSTNACTWSVRSPRDYHPVSRGLSKLTCSDNTTSAGPMRGLVLHPATLHSNRQTSDFPIFWAG